MYVSLSWLGWMAGTTALFWASPAHYRSLLLITATAAFLAVHDWQSLVWLSAMTVVTHGSTNVAKPDSRWILLGIIPLLAILVSYKLLSVSVGDDLLTTTIIPLGLSYYTLRCVHYILERYKGNLHPQSLSSLLAYLFFLPTLFVGPIHRQADFQRDLQRHRWDPALFSEGLERILYGYAKIIVLGNFLISSILPEWTNHWVQEGSILAVYFLMVKIGLNLYCQFSGYSDIAIGFARLLGFRVMENFNWPFLQRNISAFWQCWHISLTRWCRDSIYGPVVALTRSPTIGTIATLIGVALWHEVSLRYLAWGIYHGLGIVIWQQFRQAWPYRNEVEHPLLRGLIDAGSTVLTVHFVWFGFLMVRQKDLTAMLALLS